MKYPDYAPHLGFFRHFALVRGLYDRIKALEDQLRAKDASQALRDNQKQQIINGLMESVARKNGFAPIQPEPRKEFAPPVAPKSTDIMAFRQSQVDQEAHRAARETAKEKQREFADEAREIINR